MLTDDPERLKNLLMEGQARPETVGHLVADIARSLFAASLSYQPHQRLGELTYNLEHLLELFQLMPIGADRKEALSVAQEALRVSPDERDRWLDAAKDGARYLLERSRGDSFAAAREPKRRDSFIGAVSRAQAEGVF